MSRLTSFDIKSAKRIAHVVRTVERDAGQIVGRPRSHRVTGGAAGAIVEGAVVVIRAIPEGGNYGTVLQVQRITLTDAGQWSTTGDTFEMPTFPFVPAICWQRFIVPEGSEPEMMGDIQPTRTIGGVECVELFIPLYAVERRSDDPHRGPRPV